MRKRADSAYSKHGVFLVHVLVTYIQVRLVTSFGIERLSDSRIACRKNQFLCALPEHDQENISNLTAYAEHLKRRSCQLRAEAESLESQVIRRRKTKTQPNLQILLPPKKELPSPDELGRLIVQQGISIDRFLGAIEEVYDELLVSPSRAETTDLMIVKKARILFDSAKVLDDSNLSRELREGLHWPSEACRAIAVKWDLLRKQRGTDIDFEEVFCHPEGAVVPSSRKVPPNLPAWVPSSLTKYVIASSTELRKDDVVAFREKVLPLSSFSVSSYDICEYAAIFRGKFRSDPSAWPRKPTAEATPKEITGLLSTFQLSARLQVLLIHDPEWKPSDQSPTPTPVCLVLPASVVPDDTLCSRSKFYGISSLVTPFLSLASCFAFAVGCNSLNQRFFERVVIQGDAKALLSCVPILFGVLTSQAIQEAVQCLTARLRNVHIGRPFLIPSLRLGTFGCITPLRDFPPDRSCLLDYALSGPVSGWLFSVACMVIGILKTVNADRTRLLNFPSIPAATLRTSFLAGSLLTVLAPKVMLMPLSQPIPIDPLFLVGLSGTIVSSLNLLPIARLDGGRACTAVMGPRIGAIASVWTSLLLFTAGRGVLYGFGLFAVLLQFRPEIPTRNDLKEINDKRFALWIASLLGSVLTLLPFPGQTQRSSFQVF